MGSVVCVLVALAVCCCSCADTSEIEHRHSDPVDHGVAELILHTADTVIRRNDSVIVVNTRYDTTLVETGIFTYLTVESLFPSDPLVQLCKQAVACEQQGRWCEAEQHYRTMIRFYDEERPKALESMTCRNNYLSYSVHVGVLCAHAFEKLGSLDKAIDILKPWLANVETSEGIKKLYIELCIKKHGKQKVREELEHCSARSRMQGGNTWPEFDERVVSVFDADMVVPGFTDSDTMAAAVHRYIREQPYYSLVE